MQRLGTKWFCISDFGWRRWSGASPLDRLPAKAEGARSTHRLRMYRPLTSFSPPAEAVYRGVATVIPDSFLGARSESWVLGEDQCSRPSKGMLLSGLQRYYLSPDTPCTPCPIHLRSLPAISNVMGSWWAGSLCSLLLIPVGGLVLFALSCWFLLVGWFSLLSLVDSCWWAGSLWSLLLIPVGGLILFALSCWFLLVGWFSLLSLVDSCWWAGSHFSLLLIPVGGLVLFALLLIPVGWLEMYRSLGQMQG